MSDPRLPLLSHCSCVCERVFLLILTFPLPLRFSLLSGLPFSPFFSTALRRKSHRPRIDSVLQEFSQVKQGVRVSDLERSLGLPRGLLLSSAVSPQLYREDGVHGGS